MTQVEVNEVGDMDLTEAHAMLLSYERIPHEWVEDTEPPAGSRRVRMLACFLPSAGQS